MFRQILKAAWAKLKAPFVFIARLTGGLFYDANGKVIPAHFVTAYSVVLFTGVTLYLVLNRITWPHYDTFAAATMGTGAGGLISRIVPTIFSKGENK